jgi:membrane protease YdiL (CAAX protease family)
MTQTPLELEPPGSQGTWFADHPIAASLLITILTGVALQLTHMIDFQDRVADVVGWNVSVRFLDFGFRMALGGAIVLAVLPWLLGHAAQRPWFREYLRYMRLDGGPAPRLTLAATAISIVVMLALIVVLAAGAGMLRGEPDFVLDDTRWFVLILAFVPAIWEELAFRGLMLSTLQHHFRPWPAILLSSVLFGLFHISNLLLRDLGEVIPEMILATAVAIGWGYLVVKTNSVIPAMASHYFINVFIELLLDPDLSESAGAAIFGSLVIVYPFVIIITAWAIYRHLPSSTTADLSSDFPSPR